MTHEAGHKHCKDCGACLIHPAQIHRCPAFEMDPDIVDVMNAENSRGEPQNRSPYGG